MGFKKAQGFMQVTGALSLLVMTAACGSSELAGTGVSPSSKSVKGTEAPVKPVEITFANWISTEDATKKIFDQLIAAFQQSHPGITIKSIGIPFAQYKDQVLVNAAGGNPPDVIMSNQAFAPAFVGAGIVQPLDSLLGPELINDIVDGSKAGATYNGKIMEMPWTPHPNALFWNKSLFKQAGLDPEKPPKTWDEMIDMATKIAALGKGQDGKTIYGIGNENGSDSNSGSKFWVPYLAYGGKFLDDKGKLTLDQGSALMDSLSYMRKLAQNKIFPIGADTKTLRGMFSAGTLGMYIDGDFARSVYRDSSGKGEAFDKEWGVTTTPVNKTGKSETVFTEHELLISSSTKQSKEAAEFIKFLVSKDAMIMYHKSNGVMSARKSLASIPEMNEDDYAKVFNKQMQSATAYPNTNPKFDDAMKNVAMMLQLVTAGKETPDKAISVVMPKIKELYNQ